MSFALVKNCFKSFGSFIPIADRFLKFSTSTAQCMKAIERLPKTHPYPFMSKTRNHFPRARETKRIVAHGWDTRMETSGGRRILMRRILKGRHVLSH